MNDRAIRRSLTTQMRLCLLAGVGVIVTLSVAACDGQDGASADPKLKALKAEALATFVPRGGKLESQLVLGDEQSFYKPIDAQINRVFTFPNADAAARGRKAIIEVAVSSGWRLNPRGEQRGGPLFGGKRLVTGDATVSIRRYVSGGTSKISLNLEHQPCPPERCNGI